MNIRSRSLLAAVLTAALSLTCLPAVADRGGADRGGGGHDRGSENDGISADQAASIVKRAYDGRVVSVKQEGNGYKVRVLLDGGRVKTVSVDSRGNLRESN
jgi:uncharacterized membrane protein YkoI